MNHKRYFQVTGVIFAVIAVFHVARLFYGWEANIDTWEVPTWASIVGVAVAGFLAYNGWQFAKK